MKRIALVTLLIALSLLTPSLFGQPKAALAADLGFYSTSPFTATENSGTAFMTLAVTTVAPTSYSIDWGDGVTSNYTNYNAADPENGAYDCTYFQDSNTCTICYHCNLRGMHTYQRPATYTVKIEYYTGCCVHYSTSFDVKVVDAQLYAYSPASPSSITQAEGGSFDGKVAAFRDNAVTSGGGGFSAGNYTATIDWGDGSPPSAGSLFNAGGDPTCQDFCSSFSIGVQGTHRYLAPPGTKYTIRTTLTDLSFGGNSASSTTPVTVVDAALHSTAAAIAPVALHSFSGSVASFSDDAPNSDPGRYSATINWGDNTGGVAGSVMVNQNGGFDVQGAHTYASAGTYSVTATINDKDGSSTVATGTASVSNPLPKITTLNPASIQAGGNAFTLKVYGSDFVPGSQVQWNGTALQTTYVSSTELDAVVPDGNFTRPKTSQITVLTAGPGGGASALMPFFVINSNAGVTCLDTGTSSSPSSIASASTSSCPGAGSPITINAGGGTGTVAVARYSSDPGGSPSFYAQSGGAYLDVYVAPGSTFNSVTISDCALGGGSLVYWWNGSAWIQASNQSYDPGTQCTTVTVDNSTIPNVSQLGQTPFGVANQPPVLTIPGNQTAQYDDALAAPITVSATDVEPGDHLTLIATGLPQGLNFVDNGRGGGIVQGTPTAAAGSYPVTFSVSDGVNPPVSRSLTIDITREETTLTSASTRQLIAQGRSTVLSGVLMEDGATGIAGRQVTLTLGSGNGSDQSCTGTTDAAGAVSCSIPSVAVPLGPQTITVGFAGDNFYVPASTTRSALVYANLASGAFVLGDQTATSTGSVTFWGDNWSGLNALSGGAAPAAFKGFAAGTQSPPTCGASWTSRPGNSAGAPSSVPGYMAVAVSSSVTKSGNTISGNTQEIVIVKTASGYGNDPSHPGTGTIVAVLCHA